MACSSLYLRPDENVVRNGSVATSTGTTDSAYTDEWIADQILGRPVKATSGTAGWTITFTSGSISGVAVCNHNIDAARTISLTGVGITMAGPAARPNGIPYNAWGYNGTVYTSVTSLAVSVASNTALLRIGEVLAGPMRLFPGRGLLANALSGRNLRRSSGAGARSVNVADSGDAARMWRSDVVATTAELDDLMAWFESQRNGSLPSLFVPDSDVNDVWVVDLQEPEFRWLLPDRYRVTLQFLEYPRERW